MKLRISVATVLLCLSLCGLSAQNLRTEWHGTSVDGSRTGCVAPHKDNVRESLGYIRHGKYYAPSGKVYGKRTVTYRTAAAVLAAQPKMARVKDKIGYSTRAMYVEKPESALSNWFIDRIMAATAELAGRKVDIGVANFGGIRTNMPEGDVILDDMLSMFPFKNQIVYVAHKGSTIKQLLENMAATRFQVLGGVRVVAENGRIVKAEIGGEPVEDDKIYGMATISFLLNGGDDLFLGKDAVEIIPFDVDIIDVMLDYVKSETAAGRPIEYHKDGRVVVK